MAASRPAYPLPLPPAPEISEAVKNEVARLKGEMRRLVNAICEADEYSFENLKEAIKVMLWLKEYRRRLKTYHETNKEILPDFNVPQLFKCPISHQIMKDPVLIHNGETFDRQNIEEWLNEGHRTSPASGEVISQIIMVPNDLVGDMISKWEMKMGREVEFVIGSVDNGDIAAAEAGYLDVEDIVKSVGQCDSRAVKDLREYVSRSFRVRSNFWKFDCGINHMLRPIAPISLCCHEDMREDLVITLYHLSRSDKNRRFIMEYSPSLPVLYESFRCGTTETIRYAAGTMFMLSEIDLYRHVMGQAHTLEILLRLLDEGNPWNRTIVAAVIDRLCTTKLVLHRALREGAVKIAVKNIKARLLVEEMLKFLVKISAIIPDGREELVREDARSCLMGLPLEFPNISPVISYVYEICGALVDHEMNPSREDQYTESFEQLTSQYCSRFYFK